MNYLIIQKIYNEPKHIIQIYQNYENKQNRMKYSVVMARQNLPLFITDFNVNIITIMNRNISRRSFQVLQLYLQILNAHKFRENIFDAIIPI